MLRGGGAEGYDMKYLKADNTSISGFLEKYFLVLTQFFVTKIPKLFLI